MVASLAVSVAPASAWDVGPPTNVRGDLSTQVRLHVSWDPVAEQSHYQVMYAPRSDFGGYKLANVQGTTAILTGLTPGTRYYFKVSVTDAAGNRTSAWSATADFSTKPLMKISVATYNIKDPDADPPWAPFTTRGRQSAGAIVGLGVKLLGVQELFESDERATFLDYVNQKVDGDPYRMVPEPGNSDGEDSRIVFDTRVFNHVSSGGMSFPYQNGSEDRAFAWGIFQHRASERYLLFLTTHLSPRSDTADVRQWTYLLDWVQWRVRTYGVPLSVIIAGDFNTTKFEPPATMLAVSRSRGYEDVLGQIRDSYSTYRNPAQRVDAWISSSNRGIKDVRQYSVATNRNSNSIDYIFVAKALKAPFYQVYAQPRSGYIMKYLMSDHFMVRAWISQ